MTNDLRQLVASLPEKYQPIFGHPEFSEDTSRSCLDRLKVIQQVHNALRTLLGRPVRVLDLGCAQGYFSLSLAESGAEVLGIDYLPANVAVCEALASERPDLKAEFQTGQIEDIIENIQPDKFDLLLGLSVFHHVIHEKGIISVKHLLNLAAERVGCLLLEMALKSEPLYWGASQPDDPRDLLTDIAFVHIVALHSTHLSDISRPMFIASNCFWVLEKEAQPISRWTTEPHQLSEKTHQGSRRYYLSETHFLKWSRLDHDRGAHNLTEYNREIEFLTNVPAGFTAPDLLEYGRNDTEAWLVTDFLKGKLLSEFIISGNGIDAHQIIEDILSQVCQLEIAGLYHNDIRTWNVLIQDDGHAILIDYGSIIQEPRDCVWPHNIYLAFFIFLYEVTTGFVESPAPMRTIAMSPGQFPKPYDSLIRRLWTVPDGQWSFSLINKMLHEMNAGESTNTVVAAQVNEAWSTAVELGLQELKTTLRNIDTKAQHAETQAQQASQCVQHQREADLERQAQAADAHATAQEQRAIAAAEQASLHWQSQAAQWREHKADMERQAQAADAHATAQEQRALAAEQAAQHWQQQANQWHEQILALYGSTSWRITRPLRAMAGALGMGRSSRLPRAIRDPLGSAMRYVLHRPVLKKVGLVLLKPFPGITSRLRHFNTKQMSTQNFEHQKIIGVSASSNARSEAGLSQRVSLRFDDSGELPIDEILQRIRKELGATHE